MHYTGRDACSTAQYSKSANFLQLDTVTACKLYKILDASADGKA